MNASAASTPSIAPRGSIYFPLASNAYSLVAGSPVASVRGRLKLASLLYDSIFIEAGSLEIQSGPSGSFTHRRAASVDASEKWQTSRSRHLAQSAPFAISIAPETTPGVPAAGPFTPVVQSTTTIRWSPTFDPFHHEIASENDWVHYGNFEPFSEPWQKLEQEWKQSDEGNTSLRRLLPEDFVRSQVLDHVSKDLATGAAAQTDVSVDTLHGKIVTARFAGDAALKLNGFALPILVPRVRTLDWETIADLRRNKALVRLRAVLREVETEALAEASAGGDLRTAVHNRYLNKVTAASKNVESIGSIAMFGFAELVVGAATGYATMGLAMLGPVVGAAPGVAATGWAMGRSVRARKSRAWIGLKEAIQARAGE